MITKGTEMSGDFLRYCNKSLVSFCLLGPVYMEVGDPR